MAGKSRKIECDQVGGLAGERCGQDIAVFRMIPHLADEGLVAIHNRRWEELGGDGRLRVQSRSTRELHRPSSDLRQWSIIWLVS